MIVVFDSWPWLCWDIDIDHLTQIMLRHILFAEIWVWVCWVLNWSCMMQKFRSIILHSAPCPPLQNHPNSLQQQQWTGRGDLTALTAISETALSILILLSPLSPLSFLGQGPLQKGKVLLNNVTHTERERKIWSGKRNFWSKFTLPSVFFQLEKSAAAAIKRIWPGPVINFLL